ncbi:MAG: methylmalonyl-CoA epimerase [Firmicutes bacterium]|nr:methylmalonyl-CoA epimerase [Bacillota bacterium]
MKVTGLDHVALAVESIDKARPFFEQVLGLPVRTIAEVPEQGVRIAFIDAGRCRLELLEPLDEDGAVARFLARRGPGLHHIALAVDDIQAARSELDKAAPGLAVGQGTAPAAFGRRAVFLNPKRSFGALIELYGKED